MIIDERSHFHLYNEEIKIKFHKNNGLETKSKKNCLFSSGNKKLKKNSICIKTFRTN